MARIMHVLVNLGAGGAEHTLYRLVTADREHTHTVVSLLGEGVIGPRLSAAGVEVHAIGMSRMRPRLSSALQVRRIMKRVDPDIVQTWLYHADLVGGCIARSLGKRRVIWGLRNGCVETTAHSARTRVVARACAALSRIVPMSIVSCSASTVECHVAMGYARKKMQLIPNGFDTDRLKPDAATRSRVRERLGISQDELVLGTVARWNPAKDHETLLAALGDAARRDPRPWTCILAGHGMSEDNHDLMTLLGRNGVRERVRLIGEQSDVGDLMNALDVHLLSSVVEAFPNVVAEAMACGTPCVVTRVGDAAAIVASTGWVVEPRDAVSFSTAILSALQEMANPSTWQKRRDAARQRIVENYGLDRMVRAYQALWAAAGQERS